MSGEFIRFIIVGMINTANYYIIYSFFNSFLNMYYLFSHITATIISLIGSFYLNTYFTYKTKPSLKKFLQFPLTQVVNFSVSTLSIYIFVSWFHLNEKIAPILSVFFAIPFTFFISGKILKSQ